MKILSFFGPQEIIILMIVFLIGFSILIFSKAIKWIRKAGGGVRLRIIKWILIVFTFFLSVILFSLNLHPLISVLLFVSSVGAVIGIAKFRPNGVTSDKPVIR